MPDLCTIADVKSWIGVTSNNDDALLTKLVSNVSAWILNYLNRSTVLTGTYSETYDGNGGVRLALLNYPVTAVSSLTVNGVVIPASPDGVQSGYVFDQYGIKLVGSGTFYAGGTPFAGWGSYGFNVGFGNIAVSYTAGYAAIPLDLNQAAVELVSLRYRRRGWIGISNKHLATGETSTFTSDAITPEIKGTLDQYKRRVPV